MNNIENVSLSKSSKNIEDEFSIQKIKFKELDFTDSKEGTGDSKKKNNKSSKKKRKKKKKLLKTMESKSSESLKENLFNKSMQKPKNPYRLFLIYKLRKKYDAKTSLYDIKKVNELIFNVPTHFTAIFKEYLLKEEEADFLKRMYFKNEITKKLKNIFYFYDKYSKIFPNYIVIPEGLHLYKNILKKQKMIDKLQKIKEEEMQNKQMLLEGSFNTVFSNGAMDSIYNNNFSFNSNTLISLLSMENNEKNEDDEIAIIENIIKTIENYENKNIELLDKKQIIYKKEFKGLRSLSKSTMSIQNGSEVKESESNKNVDTDFKVKKSKNKKNNHIKKNIMAKNKKIVKFNENIKINTESESENEEEEEENKIKTSREKTEIINKYKKNSIDIPEQSRYKYKKVKATQLTEKNKNKNGERDDIIIDNKKKKFLILKGNRHYFIKNIEKEDKSLENTDDNEEKHFTHKSKLDIKTDKNIFFIKVKDYKNNSSFSQNKNLSKDYLSRNNKNLILYKKKLCNDTRGISISKKTNELENNDKILHKASTNYAINGSKIVKIKKCLTNEPKNISPKNEDKNENKNGEKNENEKENKNENENLLLNYNDNKNLNKNYYKTITYSKSNFDLNEQNKNNSSTNGSIYYKKHKLDTLRNSYGEKSCPKTYNSNKFLIDVNNEIKKKHFINNNSIENKDKDKKQNNEDVNSAQTHRYYRINQFNNKKFRLKAPKNYIN